MTDKKRVLIFDDDKDILEMCSIILSESGYDVFTSSDCFNVVDKVSSIRPDVIFMDNWIPDMGGIEATRLLKSTDDLKDIPVIYFSANNDIHLLKEKAGANSFLAKPFDLYDLEKVILENLD
jgi:CheY-like chemotaxis protein